jgi:methanogenic corrinoid protein MtbC1
MNQPESAPAPRSEPALLSIGALSRATGVATATLRTWEQRYGFPRPLRRPSGHRLYPLEAALRLRRIVHAIARGHRAADVMALDPEALESLLDTAASGPLAAKDAPVAPGRPPGRRATGGIGSLRAMRDAVRRLDGPALQTMLESAAARVDPVTFLEEVARPLMRAVGDGWAAGRIDVRHEHFASARLADVLRQATRRFDPSSSGPRAVLASLPGDAHELGLLMAALVFSASRWQVVYMGRDTPPDQLQALAGEVELNCVALGISATAPGNVTRALRSLRRGLPRELPIVVGGSGAPDDVAGVTYVRDARALQAWIAQHPPTAARS